jgi:RNase P protein component
MREAVQFHIEKIKPSFNIIFVAKEIAKDKTVAELTTATENLLKKAGLLNG